MSGNDIESAFSTFNGHVHAIPDILVDNFTDFSNGSTKYCFISHAHADHWKNIQNCKSNMIITTSTTAGMIDSPYILPVIKFYPVDKWIELESGLKFMFIPNFHCIGSIMILFNDIRSGKVVTVLYTGDVRFSKSVLGVLQVNEALSPFIYGNKLLDWIYFDSTFTYRKDIIDIVDNNKGIEMLLEVMEMYPQGTTFRFLNCILGFEEVWYRVQQKFESSQFEFSEDLTQRISKGKLYPKKETMINILKNISNIDLSTSSSPSTKPARFKIIFSSMSNTEAKRAKLGNSEVLIRHAIDLSKHDYLKYYMPTNDETILSKSTDGGLIWDGIHRTFDSNDSIRLKFQYLKNQQTFYPLELKFMYSRHSSYRETREFLKLFSNVSQIWPCTEGSGSRSRNLSMKRCYGIQNCLYDEMTFPQQFNEIIQPLVIYNLWDRKQRQSVYGHTVHLEQNSISTTKNNSGDSTDEDIDVSILGRHQRETSVQTSLDDGIKAVKGGKSLARKIQGGITNTRDRTRARFAYNRITKPNQWVIKRKILE